MDYPISNFLHIQEAMNESMSITLNDSNLLSFEPIYLFIY